MYFDPEAGGDLTADEVAALPPESQKEIAKAWFLERYENPAENTPYETAEGGYIYIWGGPHHAGEILESEFHGIIKEKLLEEIAEELESEAGTTEWASVPGGDDFDVNEQVSEFYPRFQTSVDAVRRLLDHNFDKTDESFLFALLFVNAITILEAYLSDVFMSLVLKHPTLLRKFVEQDPIFKKQKATIAQLFHHMDTIPARVKDHLYVFPFHRLEKVRKMYASVLGITFPSGWADILKAVNVRHDLVHRNGVTKEGKSIITSLKDVQTLMTQIESFISSIDEKVTRLTESLITPPKLP